MKPWNFESGSLIYSMETLEEIYKNSFIDDYLAIGNHDYNFFLIGPKGIGKTMLLNFKSFLYKDQLIPKGFKVYPEKSLAEELIITNNLLSKEEILQYSKLEIWERIWLFTLNIIACKTNNIEIPKELTKLIGSIDTCSSIITNLLSERKSLIVKLGFISELLKLTDGIQNGVGIFIDSIDQATRQFLIEYHYSDDSDAIPPSILVWTNAQLGLIISSYNINRHNSHIKIFTSIRSEAYNAMKSDLKLNLENYATLMKYDKEEIRKIFELNISLMKKNELVSPNAKKPIEKFLGFSQMAHPFAKKNKRKIKEDAFEFLYRHSLGRAREIVYMGNKLYNNITNKKEYSNKKEIEKVEKVRWEVNELAYDLLLIYFEEIIPQFNIQKLIDFLEVVQCNVIPEVCISDEFRSQLNKYYSIGLIGCITKKNFKINSDTYRQVFLPASQYSYLSLNQTPSSKYYLTHPSVDYLLKKHFDTTFYNKNNIIGNGYDFIDSEGLTRMYDVALSYASEDRSYVEELSNELKKLKISVFYDNHNKTSLWGKDLYQHLSKIYKHLALFCVIFISKNYPIKKWTQLELKNAQDRAFNQDIEYILPYRFDDTQIDGINSTVGYINNISPKELALEIKQKLTEYKRNNTNK